jgi:hypothetical protein
MTGQTYSTTHYDEFKRTGNQNIFEEVVDSMVLDGVSGMNESFKRAISNLPRSEKRMTILSLLDKDLNLFKKIKALTNKDINRLDHIKDVIIMLRDYVKVGDVEKKKFGEVMTPLSLVKEMLSTLPEETWSNPNLKILDPANGTGPYPAVVIYKLMKGLEDWEPNTEKRYKHIIENMIYTCELQAKNVFLWLCVADPFDEYETNTYWGSFLDEAFDKHMKEVWGVNKFDIVVGNPPYQSYTHLKFLNKSIDSVKEDGVVLFVQPSQPFLDVKPKTLVNDERIALVNVQKYNTKLILVNGNLLFNSKMFFTPLSITYLIKHDRIGKFIVDDRTKNTIFEYPTLKEVNLLGFSKEYQSLKSKIFEKVEENGHINLWKKKFGKYYVGISEIRGNICEKNMIKYDFYTILPQESPITESPNSKHFNAGFETKKEAENFKEYLKTKFARFCLAIYKINSTLAGTSSVLNAIPILDFNEEWTDDKLKKYFDITNSEWIFIESIIPNFYKK